MNKVVNDINEYVNSCWETANEYAENVNNGSIITSIWMKEIVSWYIDCKNATYQTKYTFKPKKVDRVFRFFYLINVYDDNNKEYRRLRLEGWQALLIVMLFGFYQDNRRVFTESFTFMGRGNGKTTLGVALSLYFLLGYKQKSPQSVIISTVEARRKIIEDLHRTTMNSPELYPYVHFNNGAVMLNSYDTYIKKGDRQIIKIDDIGSIKVVPNDDKKLDSLEIVLAFIDEIHLLKDEMVYRNAQKSAGKRDESLVMLISTAGYSTEGFCVDLVKRAKRIALGEIPHNGLLPFLFCLDPDDDPEDISNRDLWKKCNPSLGSIKYDHKMEKYYNDALVSPKAKADFITKDLNTFIDYSEDEIISEEHRNECSKPVDLSKWEGKDCYLGLDLSVKNDLSSLVCLFHDEETNSFEAYPYFYMGSNTKYLLRKTGEDLNNWIANGNIVRCKTEQIDYGLIVEKINELSQKFNIVGIGYDPYAWDLFKQYLTKTNVDCGEEFMVYPRGRYLAQSLVLLMQSIYTQKIIWSDNPVMKWNWKNIVMKLDIDGYYRIRKDKCKDSIDGAIATNNAMALYYYRNVDPNVQAF